MIRGGPLVVEGILLNLNGQVHPNPGVWYIRKLSLSPTLRTVDQYAQLFDLARSVYLVTFPLRNCFLLIMFGVTQSLLGILRKYLRYTTVTAEEITTPEANAVTIWYSVGIASRNSVTFALVSVPFSLSSLPKENIRMRRC